MRSLSFILAIFFAFLVIAPCNDTSANSSISQNTEIQQNDTKKEHHSENCTPFCNCNCCRGQMNVIEFKFLEIPDQVFTYSGKIISYHSLEHSSVFYGIWQPPKLG